MLAGIEAEPVFQGVVPEGLDGVPVGVGAVGTEGGDDLVRCLRERERKKKKKKDG